MPLDPQAQAMRDAKERDGVAPLYTMSLDEARAADLASIRAAGGNPEKVHEVLDHWLPGPGGKLLVRVYRPSAEQSLPVLMYFFGGGWVLGTVDTADAIARSLANAAGCIVAVPGYRLAPEHPFPAALEDAVAAWRHMRTLRRGWPLFVAGDSAGGGLALSLMLRLRDLGEPLPDGAVLLSPSVDLAEPGGHGEEGATDLWLTREHLSAWFRHYVGKADPSNPLVSPVRANLSGLPPFLLLAGSDELLLGEGRRMVDRALSAGVDAQLLVGEGMQHDWPLTLPWLPQSRHAWKVIGGFLDDHASDAQRPGAAA